MEYLPIDELYFRSLKFPSRICQKKAVCLDPNKDWMYRGQYNNGYELTSVQEVIDYFKVPGSIEKATKKLRPDNWEYFNCLIAGFRNGVIDTDAHKINGGTEISLEDRNNTLSPEYYDRLPKMTDDEILVFNKNNPINFDTTHIRHGTHRAYAMIGRLIRGEKYIPFYIKKENFNPIIKIKYLSVLDELNIPRSEYTICQSSILSLIGNRANDDLDIVVSTRLREVSLDGTTTDCKIHPNIEIFALNKGKFNAFGCSNDDQLIQDYSINICGYNFVEPRFYFSRLWPENEKKVCDHILIKEFMDSDLYKVSPYNNISIAQWGVDLLPLKQNK